jgi:hypothetical protein
MFKYQRNISMSTNSSLPVIPRKLYPLKVDLRHRSIFNFRFTKLQPENENMVPCFGNSIRVHSPYNIPTFFNVNEGTKIEHSMIIEVTPEITRTENSVTYHTTLYPTDDFGNETVITVRMNGDDAILYRRFQQFTISDAVSQVGGLLGLFAGVSMLSVVEFVNHFTLRAIVDAVRIFKRQ